MVCDATLVLGGSSLVDDDNHLAILWAGLIVSCAKEDNRVFGEEITSPGPIAFEIERLGRG